MKICKASTLRLKVLNKHSITHIMYIEMEIFSAIKLVNLLLEGSSMFWGTAKELYSWSKINHN